MMKAQDYSEQEDLKNPETFEMVLHQGKPATPAGNCLNLAYHLTYVELKSLDLLFGAYIKD